MDEPTDKIQQYRSLMRQKKYKEAGETAEQNPDELMKEARKYHQQMNKSKDRKEKDEYEEKTPPSLLQLLDLLDAMGN